MDTPPRDPGDASEFDRLGEAPQPGLVAEFLDFLKANKKWWLLPILVVIGLFGLLVALAVSPAAPFIYTLF
jgi:hypothetical protein